MTKQNNTKLFAFKLAEKKQEVKSDMKWTARDNVATAGCTGPFTRASTTRAYDGGIYC
ncbi:hypothetical protein PVT67_14445 [Gallaecimonas kandeliae]|uniref:hypothetical protein n=1 Tax=Gallaecimonas kandeliae TaxID=3029055 RepID=UPI002647DEB4|nr:hypothetical protein [Gallaecimonas kandeliae]WKE64853.1 hypothetical protein PVT67_14445 [Gallaecimonas kandeliae]